MSGKKQELLNFFEQSSDDQIITQDLLSSLESQIEKDEQEGNEEGETEQKFDPPEKTESDQTDEENQRFQHQDDDQMSYNRNSFFLQLIESNLKPEEEHSQPLPYDDKDNDLNNGVNEDDGYSYSFEADQETQEGGEWQKETREDLFSHLKKENATMSKEETEDTQKIIEQTGPERERFEGREEREREREQDQSQIKKEKTMVFGF